MSCGWIKTGRGRGGRGNHAGGEGRRQSVREGQRAVVVVTEVVIPMETAVVVEEMVPVTEGVVLVEGVMTVVEIDVMAVGRHQW